MDRLGGLIVGIALVIWTGMGFLSEAQNFPDCSTSDITDLVPCLTFLTGSGQNSTPQSSCCDGIKTVVAATPACVCEIIGYGNNNSLPATFNLTLAKQLPKLCSVAEPSQCPAFVNNGPATSPSASPGPDGLVLSPSSSTGGATPAGPGSDAPRMIPGTIFGLLNFAVATAVGSILLCQLAS